MSRLHTDLTTSDYGSDYNSSDALRAILRPIGASQLGELERLLRQSPEALTLLSERATLDAMLALANVLSKLGLKRELLNFKTFALGSGIASESSHIGSMGSEHATGIKELADRLFGDALAVTPATAAKALSCSRSYVYELLKSGQLDGVRLGRGKRARQRVTVVSLIEFIVKGGIAEPCRPTPAARMATRYGKRGAAGALL